MRYLIALLPILFAFPVRAGTCTAPGPGARFYGTHTKNVYFDPSCDLLEAQACGLTWLRGSFQREDTGAICAVGIRMFRTHAVVTFTPEEACGCKGFTAQRQW